MQSRCLNGHDAEQAFKFLILTTAIGLGVQLRLPFVLWTVSDGLLPPAASKYSYEHREDKQGRYFLVMAAYCEDEDGDGKAAIQELVQLPLWFSR